jgi:hypothetical protein
VPVIHVNAGDLMGKRQLVEKEQSRFLCEVTGTFGLDAIGLGEMDLNYGLDFLQEMASTHGLPFVNANVKDPETGELVFPPYVVVERAGLRFGITSVLDPVQKIVTMSARDPVFTVEDPLSTLRNLIPEMRKEVDTVILLSHMDDRNSEQMLKDLEGVDIVVMGHTYRALKTEKVIGGAVVLAAVYEGRFIGRSDLELDADGKVQAFAIEVTSLDEAIADDPVVLEKVEQFKTHLKDFRLTLRGDHQPVKGSEKEQFLTERVCAKCHADSWQAVKVSAHQAAFASLQKKGQGYNPDCLVCHVVGYEYKNGYDDYPPFNRLGNVQCEACHGYGTQHARDGSMLKMARESCTACHDKENSPEFDYATYWEQIKH